MEFPDLGRQCNEPFCRQLDFLPVKCDACKKIYCSEHYKYETHNCPLAYQKNVQVPVCPLCNSPVPGRADELPDIRVSRHIDSDCNSDRAVTQRKKKVYSNKCSSKGCKQKEMIPLICDDCGLNFCLKHRHPPDHDCTAVGSSKSKPLSPAARAALSRSNNSSVPKSRSLTNGISSLIRPSASYNQVNLQGNLSETDALQVALQASMSAGNTSTAGDGLTQEQADFALAQAIAESEREAQRRHNPSRTNRNCEIS